MGSDKCILQASPLILVHLQFNLWGFKGGSANVCVCRCANDDFMHEKEFTGF